jgi:hypothetical protein
LIDGWKHTVPSFPAVLHLLQEIGTRVWFLAHGGQTLYRKILDELVNHLKFAQASDWLELLAFSDRFSEGTVTSRSKIAKGFRCYRDHGVSDERMDCTTVDEMNELVDSLSELDRNFNTDFSDEISSLREAVAEREETNDPLSEGSGIPTVATPQDAYTVTDDDVRQMFRTLVDEE